MSFGTIITWGDLTTEQRQTLLKRPALSQNPDLQQTVQAIVREVRTKGDTALQNFSLRFDKADLASFRVSKEEIAAAVKAIPREDLAALECARNNILAFHRSQPAGNCDIETMPGVRCERIARAIERVGLYAPGGSAPLPSTVLMLGLPAQIAGCARRVLCTPPRPDGSLPGAILVAAHLAGIDEIYKIGGAQAIAALAYGTESIPKVDKIFGPGNAWVTETKQFVAHDPQGAACDMPAGPSEVLIIADDTANPVFVAADLLSQAEHGPDSQVVLVALSSEILISVADELVCQLETLPRKDIARASMKHSLAIQARDRTEALDISNAYAPEHLILQVKTPRALLSGVQNAGSVFMGPWSPESVGDYASGTNHVLPTYGYARSYGGVSVDSFRKYITVQELTEVGLQAIGPTVERLAALEGLDAHRIAVSKRLATLREAL